MSLKGQDLLFKKIILKRKGKAMKFKKKALTAFLTALMMLLSSCAVFDEGSDIDSTDTRSVSDTAEDPNSADSADRLEIPNETFGGIQFTILTHEDVSYNYGKIDFDEPSDDPYDNAMYLRSREVEDLLGINISQKAVDLFAVYTTFKTSTMTDSGDYDMTFVKVPHACNAVTDGLASPLSVFEYIDLSKVWWNDAATEQMTMLDTAYMAAGDIAISDKDCIWTVQFNKQMIKDNGFEDPYELVISDEWTWDKMFEMCDVVSYDANNDGVMDKNDMFGLCTEQENYPAMWMSAGLTLASINEEGYPEVTWNTERFFDVYTKLADFMVSDCVDSDWDYTGFSGTMFNQNQTLFRTSVAAGLKSMRESEIDFGVVPFPKYDSNVKEYYSMVAGNSSIMIIGKDNSDPYITGIVTEAMAAYGHDIVLPTYYERQLKSRYARDEVMPQMLDIIFTNRIYDLGMFYDLGLSSLMQKNVNVSTAWGQNQRTMDKKVQKIITAIEGE